MLIKECAPIGGILLTTREYGISLLCLWTLSMDHATVGSVEKSLPYKGVTMIILVHVQVTIRDCD